MDCLRIYAVALILLATLAACAVDKELMLAGDISGGSPFWDVAPDPAWEVAGYVVRAGNAVDGIQLIYRRPDGSLINGAYHGGSGGTESKTMFGNGEHITGMWGYASPNIRCFAFHTNVQQYHCSGREEGTAFRYVLPISTRMRGISGRSGQLIDAIGIVAAGP